MERVERALELALVVMKNGGSTRSADRTFRNVLKGYGLGGFPLLWRLDFVLVQGTLDGRPVTIARQVGPVGVNLVRASAAMQLGERLARGEALPEGLGPEVERINTLAPIRNRWVPIGAAAISAAAFSRLVGGDWGAFGLALVAAGVTQFVRLQLQARKLPVAPVTLAAGLISACLAAVGLRLGISQTVPAALISSVIFMVPGLPLINGYLDLISLTHLLVGLERIAHALSLFLTLALALAFAFTAIL